MPFLSKHKQTSQQQQQEEFKTRIPTIHFSHRAALTPWSCLFVLKRTLTFMSMKMRLFKHKNPPQGQQQPSVSSSTRQSSWLPCMEQPNTLSFRATTSQTPCTATDHPSSTLTQYLGDEAAEELESVVRGVTMIRSSDRLFFSPEKTNSILKKPKTDNNSISTTQAENAAPISIAMESLDPYTDFRSSMEEMVQAHGLHEWDLLEELLGCYLMLNEKKNHGYIIRAFADLVLKSHFVHLTNNSYSASVCCSPPSVVSDSFVTSFSSPQHLSSTSTTAETSCSSSSIAPAEAACDRGRRGDK